MKNKYIKYFIYLLRHKYYIFIECIKNKLFISAIIHDWDKFIPSNFISYSRALNRENFLKEIEKEKYNRAVFNHRHRSKHHWEYWVAPAPTGLYLFRIPEKYIKEMICDWICAAKVQNKKQKITTWLSKNERKIFIHPDSMTKILYILCRKEKKNG